MHGDKGFGVGREGKALQVNMIERAEIDTETALQSEFLGRQHPGKTGAALSLTETLNHPSACRITALTHVTLRENFQNQKPFDLAIEHVRSFYSILAHTLYLLVPSLSSNYILAIPIYLVYESPLHIIQLFLLGI